MRAGCRKGMYRAMPSASLPAMNPIAMKASCRRGTRREECSEVVEREGKWGEEREKEKWSLGQGE